MWFMVLNMFHGTLQPLAGASRTLSQLAEDGYLPSSWMIRNRHDVPWVTTALTAVVAILFLQSGDPTWVIAAANLAYLIGIGMPSVAVWLLRRNEPRRRRPYRAPRGTIALGLAAACVWLMSALLGFEQFGLPTVITSLALCYASVVLYGWRRWRDRRAAGVRRPGLSLHVKLTLAMVTVIALDGVGYLIAINHVNNSDPMLVAALKDIFVGVALLTINVGLVIPGIVSHAVGGIATAARRLTEGTLAELTVAMRALGRGDLDEARTAAEVVAVQVRSGGELGEMAAAFNQMQQEVGRTAAALDFARDELNAAKSALARTAEAMQYQALHDPLTGLPNRTLFVDRLTHALTSCGRRGTTVAVLFLDVDHFKLVNDSLGHSAGDALLMEIASRLDSTMRAGDTVARFGGDEFLLICEDIRDTDEAREIAARTIAVLKRPFWLVGAEHVASTSIGISIATGPGRDPEDLIREADAAMYRAKEAGRDGFELYDEVMRADAMHRLGIEGELRAAIRNNELRLDYQPLIDLRDRRIAGVEALVRWDHPRLGRIGPDEFIPVAEQTGVIVDLGAWVLRTAIADAVQWRELVPDRPVPVAVNLSARQVTHRTLLDDVEFALASSGLDPELLHLEITESTLLDPSDLTIGRLLDLKALGVSIVLDDFGTGYSSLAYVKRFPIDTLKIDRAFIAEVTRAGSDSSIVEAIVAMAHGLKVGVIAEGVETAAQAETLARLGCGLAQGHLFSAPVRSDRIAAMLVASAFATGPAFGVYDAAEAA
jgi:diguanylate cyclase (GGDEF)-like protein